MATVSLRISEETAATLEALASELNQPKRSIVEAALRRYHSEVRLRAAGESVARLRSDPKRWRAYQQEREAVLGMVDLPRDKR